MNGWILEETNLDLAQMRKNESLFAQGNGFLGWRGTFEEGCDGDTLEGNYINGFYETYPVRYPEIAYGYPVEGQTMLNVMNAKRLALTVDGEPVTMRSERVAAYHRALDYRDGVLTRNFAYTTASGVPVQVCLRRLISFTRPAIGAVELTVTASGAVPVSVTSALEIRTHNQRADKDPRVGTHLPEQCFELLQAGREQETLYAAQRTRRSRLPIACAAHHQVTGGEIDGYEQSDERLSLQVTARLTKGQTLRLVKTIAYGAGTVPSDADLLSPARAAARDAAAAGFDALVEENRAFLAAHWARTDVRIDGDDLLEQGLRFNSFHVLQSVGRDGLRNIAAKGLSGEGYEGHYFWDTEMFVIPALLYSHPEICRSLLRYRYSKLDSARQRAREMGHKTGALFPWRTIGGSECSTFFPAGTAQYHINGDIAMAVKNYLQVTGDVPFLLEAGAELLFETARLWADLGHFSQRRGGAFCIDCVTGPDEYTAVVNNNFYTNRIARENLWYAAETYRTMAAEQPQALAALSERIGLRPEEVATWQRAADAMYFPYDEQLGIFLQDDSFADKADWDFAGTTKDQHPLLLHFHPLVIYRHKVLKQADTVLADLMFDQYIDEAQMRRDYDYYEPLTTHDSSLSACTYSMVACRIGYLDPALEHFMRSARTDLDDHKGNTKDGVHIANMAGALVCIQAGFGGVRQREGQLLLQPVIPAQWQGYQFPLRFQGRSLTVAVDQEKVRVTLVAGDALTLRCYQETHTLATGQALTMPMAGKTTEGAPA